MVFRVYCLCLNATLHLQDVAEDVTGECGWLKPDIDPILKSSFSVAGTCFQFKAFVSQQKELQHDGIWWRITQCTNCRTNLFAEPHPLKVTDRSKTPSYILYNGAAVREDEVPSVKRKPEYSPVFNLVIYPHGYNSNTIIDAPSEDDVEAIALFRSLQSKVDAYVEKEMTECERRIEEYREQQNDDLKKLAAKTYTDRKILWHSLSSAPSRKSEVEGGAPKTTSGLTSGLASALASAEGSSSSSYASTSGSQKDSSLKRRNLMFASPAKGRSSKGKQPQGGNQKAERDVFDEDEEDDHRYPTDPQDHDEEEWSSHSGRGRNQEGGASSVPVSIPSQFQRWDRQDESDDTMMSKSFMAGGRMRPPHEVVDQQEQDAVGHSFAVPRSRNRARTIEKKYVM